MSLLENFLCFVCFGHVISQFFFRNFTFEIIDYLKCRSNGSSRRHFNQMLEFSLKGQMHHHDDLGSIIYVSPFK